MFCVLCVNFKCMISRFFKVINHRDVVLTLAIITGLLLGDHSRFLGDISVWILALVMVFSTLGFSFRDWIPFQKPGKEIGVALFLNYVVFGGIVIAFAYLLPSGGDFDALRHGLIIIAAAPAGPSIVAFTILLKGDASYSVNGVFGITLAALGVTPLLLFLFLGVSDVTPAMILPLLVKLIIFPIIISRFLRHSKIVNYAKRAQSTVVKWGFFLVIVPTIGLSRDVIFAEPVLVLWMAAIFTIAVYGLGGIYFLIMCKKQNPERLISGILLTVIKSSAFSAVVALNFFPDAVTALPSAVLSVFVTTFYITFSQFSHRFIKASV